MTEAKLSTGAKVAIGMGSVAAVGGGGYLLARALKPEWFKPKIEVKTIATVVGPAPLPAGSPTPIPLVCVAEVDHVPGEIITTIVDGGAQQARWRVGPDKRTLTRIDLIPVPGSPRPPSPRVAKPPHAAPAPRGGPPGAASGKFKSGDQVSALVPSDGPTASLSGSNAGKQIAGAVFATGSYGGVDTIDIRDASGKVTTVPASAASHAASAAPPAGAPAAPHGRGHAAPSGAPSASPLASLPAIPSVPGPAGDALKTAATAAAGALGGGKGGAPDPTKLLGTATKALEGFAGGGGDSGGAPLSSLSDAFSGLGDI